MDASEFQEILWQKSKELFRDMPWRSDTRPYYVLVSELMLQQTQVDRVIPKFLAFIEAFPDEHALARASLADVLRLWNGLGYNRRAKFLHEAAREIERLGAFPATKECLVALPGVGPNTAGAILAYAYNQPVVFVETNVRTVYFHHFFETEDEIDDKDIVTLVQATLDREHPREFYWAIMDYGTWLKRHGAGRIAMSKHYKKQSRFKGSVREIRGQIVAQLAQGDLAEAELKKRVTFDERFVAALGGLLQDGLVSCSAQNILHLTK